jgi:hypothetical protein
VQNESPATMANPKDTKNTTTTGSADPVQDEWQKRTATWEQTAQAQGFVKPGEHIDPSKIRMEVGPPMTAEQFKVWMEQRKEMMKKLSE